ncbi:MAG: TPM domain-containing protein [Deltaproteobacteria bacterium]|nr:TPM domain-containing protein [Deltaproteobacteria bacterium]MDQ3297778.1 TPM domain-containing protein [Myxococcota bacterium]
MLALLMLVFQVASVTDIASPRPTGWVTDQAAILDDATEAKLNALAQRLFTSKGIELAIVTVDDVPGTPKQFATKLFNHWGIGAAQTNTGVLVLLVMGKRRLEVETGTGIEAALPAAWLADMQARDMVPRFKQKDFPGGLVAGVEAISAHLGAAPGESTSVAPPGEYRDDGTVVPAGAGASDPGTPGPTVRSEPVRVPPPAYVAPVKDDDDGAPSGAIVGGGLGLLGLGGGAALIARHRRRRRICTTCQPNRRMLPLDEVEDDKHLDEGQRKEENLRSVDYEVLICAGCQQSRTLRHNKWFSGYGTCSSCSYKTASSDSRTIVHATYDHGGQVEVTERCMHCSRVHSYTRYTSQLTRPTSSTGSSSSSSSYSSGGGSSGFGGGSSSGGGAGSSW